MDEKKDKQLKATLKAIYSKPYFRELAETFRKNEWMWRDVYTGEQYIPNEREIRNVIYRLAIDLYNEQKEEYLKERTIGTGRLYLNFLEDEEGEMEANIEVRFNANISVGTIIEDERLTVCCPEKALTDYHFDEI